MSAYPPPTYPEPLSLFNPIYWEQVVTSAATQGVTVEYANAHYLKYPVAQGLETFEGIANNSTTNLKGTLTMNAQLQMKAGNPQLFYEATNGAYSQISQVNTTVLELVTPPAGTFQIGNGVQATNLTIPVGNLTVAGGIITGTSTTQPVSTNTTQLATCAFVLANAGNTPATKIYKATDYRIGVNNSDGWQIGTPAPYPTVSFTNFSTLNYWDGIQFKIVANMTADSSVANATIGNPAMPTMNWSYACESFIIYPKTFSASQIYSPTTLTLGNLLKEYYPADTFNTNYAPINSTNSGGAVPNGRPFWAGAITADENTLSTSFGTIWTNDGTTASITFLFQPLYYNTTSLVNTTFSIELINTGKLSLANISTSGFNQSNF